MNIRELAVRLLCVHKCASCRTILSQENFHDALCPKCMEIYRRAKTESCSQCLRSAIECTCQPKMLSASGSLCLCKLFFYQADKAAEAQNKLVYFLKHQPNKRVEKFVAQDLSTILSRELLALGIENARNEAVIVPLPRGRKALIENGFDQSDRICRMLSEHMDIPFVPAIRRRSGGKEQKKLTAEQRKKNMKSLMLCNEKYAEDVKGKYVILLDDVVTTGASMSSCLPILRKMGAKGVVGCALAADRKKKSER